jgi:hypothetical protein
MFLIRDAVPADMAVLRDVFRRSSLSNEGDRVNLLANPDALEFPVPLSMTGGPESPPPPMAASSASPRPSWPGTPSSSMTCSSIPAG